MRILALSVLFIMCYGIHTASGWGGHRGRGKCPPRLVAKLEGKVDKLIKENQELAEELHYVKKCLKETKSLFEQLKKWLCKFIPKLCCYINGGLYLYGESFPKGDGCNNCTCQGNNDIYCTKIFCGGDCPIPNPNIRCMREETCENPCPSDTRCCKSSCGERCTSKLCPPVRDNTIGICLRECPDKPCPSGKVCCSNGCGQVCLDPVTLQSSLCDVGVPLVINGTRVFCGRGPNRQNCPVGYFCNIEPADRYAVCCQTPTPAPEMDPL